MVADRDIDHNFITPDAHNDNMRSSPMCPSSSSRALDRMSLASYRRTWRLHLVKRFYMTCFFRAESLEFERQFSTHQKSIYVKFVCCMAWTSLTVST